MAASYEVLAKVICQEGHCAAGHKVGDEFIMGLHTPAGLCCSAFQAIFPTARVLRFGGSFPWSDDPETGTSTCPDGKNPVTFELRRMRR
ncbi:MAG: TIGR04076 family protein [Chloroflexi bacterium]|nr:TIGR04076 family protein [Chloroflexota bacterium]